MIKKIGDFLFIILILSTVLIMLAVSGSAPDPAPAPTPAPTEQTAPSQPEEAPPEQTRPAAPQTQPAQPSNPDQPAYRQVKQALEDRTLEARDPTTLVWVAELNAWEDAKGTNRESLGWTLARFAAERKLDPISAFLALEKEGLFDENEDCGCSVNAFPVPRKQKAKTYPATEGGARLLLTDLLLQAAELEDGLDLELALLGGDGEVSLQEVRWDREQKLWYASFGVGGECSTHLVCFELRPDAKGETITDVGLRYLSIRSAQGGDYAQDVLDRRGNTQSVTLMSAAELLLTGKSKAHTGSSTEHTWLGGYSSTMERDSFSGNGEEATLTTYRLRK